MPKNVTVNVTGHTCHDSYTRLYKSILVFGFSRHFDWFLVSCFPFRSLVRIQILYRMLSGVFGVLLVLRVAFVNPFHFVLRQFAVQIVLQQRGRHFAVRFEVYVPPRATLQLLC